MIPHCGYSGLSTVLSFTIGSVLDNAGIPISVELLVNLMPIKVTIQTLVTKNVIDTCILAQESIQKDTNVYISSDKSNKKGNNNLVKHICWYDIENKKVKVFLLDVDCTNKDTANMSAAVVHSLSQLFGDFPIILHGQCTDSGRGGTKHAFARAMQAKGMTHVHYLVTTWLVHNLQTCIRNGVQHVLD